MSGALAELDAVMDAAGVAPSSAEPNDLNCTSLSTGALPWGDFQRGPLGASAFTLAARRWYGRTFGLALAVDGRGPAAVPRRFRVLRLLGCALFGRGARRTCAFTPMRGCPPCPLPPLPLR